MKAGDVVKYLAIGTVIYLGIVTFMSPQMGKTFYMHQAYGAELNPLYIGTNPRTQANQFIVIMS